MTNEQIIEHIRTNPSNKNDLLQTLFEQNQTLIRTYIKPYTPYMEYEDLMQQAFLSMYEAIEKYDQAKGLFMTIYPYYVRKDILKLLENNTAAKVPAYIHTQIREADKIKQAYIDATGSAPNNKYIASTMGISLDQLKEVWKAKRVLKSLSLDKPIKDAEDEELTLQDTIPGTEDTEAEILDKVIKEQLKQDIWEAVAELPTKDRQAIELYYKSGTTLKEIGEALGVSTERTRQYINSGLRKLRSGKNKKRLEHYFDTYINVAYKGSVGSWKHSNTSATEYVALKLYEASESIKTREERIKQMLAEEEQAQEQRKLALIREKEQQAEELAKAQAPVIELPQETISNVIAIMRERGQEVTEADIMRVLNCRIAQG